MTITELFQTFQTQEQAIEYLEAARWRGKPICPYCSGSRVGRHVSGDRKSQRWQCQDCLKAFSVTVGTIFHGTHIPLRNWFLVLSLMLNAKKSASACQISRDLGIRRATVWSMMHRVRIAMANDAQQSHLLHGLVEADETYVGGKPRRGNRKPRPNSGTGKSKRGMGTDKMPVIGIAERNGRVIAEPITRGKVNGKILQSFIRENVDLPVSLVMTDDHQGYANVAKMTAHASINHRKAYAEGMIHTNTIEGFWALLKRAWYGQHHNYSRKYAKLYVSEACYKYNSRRSKTTFVDMIGLMVAA